MLNLFSSKPSSKVIANERLKLILIQDKEYLSDELLDKLKCEILHVINKYIEIDVVNTKIKLTKSNISESDYSILVANIPLKKG